MNMNFNFAKLWLVVKPSIGIPLFFLWFGTASLAIYFSILSHTTWFPAFLNGKGKPAVVGSIDPTAGAPVAVASK